MLFNRFLTLAAVPVLALVLCVSSISFSQSSKITKGELALLVMEKAAGNPSGYTK